MQNFEPISDTETINEIIVNFREAVLKVVPHLESAGYLWREFLENESIETIIESLYEALVVAKLHFIMGNTETMKDLAGYGMFYKNYNKHYFIRVIDKNNPDNVYAFSYLTSQDKAFDSVNCNLVNMSGKVDEEVILKFDNVDFIV
jgi:hypothetical protein